MTIRLLQGDCLEIMKEIPDGSVDMILTDPPYGTAGGMGASEPRYKRLAESEWDKCLPQKAINEECSRVLRTNGAMAIFSQEPFTSSIIQQSISNLPFSYRLVWLKDHFANSLVVNKAPVNYTEDICVFRNKRGIDANHDYEGIHPLRPYAKLICEFIGKKKKEVFAEMGHQGICHFMRHDSSQWQLCTEKTYKEIVHLYGIDELQEFICFTELSAINKTHKESIQDERDKYLEGIALDYPVVFNLQEGAKYKSNVLEYKKDYTGLHPTQKPIALMEDLIRTYTNEGQLVLDFTMGSGTTGVACKNLNRRFIGIELDEQYFKVAQDRISAA